MLETIASAVSATLPPALSRAVTLANVREQRLVVLADSGAAAARVRLLAPQVLRAARDASGLALSELTVKVTSTAAAPPDMAIEHRSLSRAAADHLAHAAESMADPELRVLLSKLASLA